MAPGKIVEILDELSELARNDESAYHTAAVDSADLSLTAFSISCAVDCGERAEELDDISILYRTGRKPLRRHLAHLARAWDWLGTVWPPRDDMQIVEACKRREDASLRAFKRALGMPLPGNLRRVLQHHLAVVRQNQSGFRGLRHYFWQLANEGEPLTTQADFQPS